jgi:hypothetical protein
MKSISIKSIEIFTDGTVNFSYIFLKSRKQVMFNEKDAKNSLFFKKLTTPKSIQSSSRTSYKSRYKF